MTKPNPSPEVLAAAIEQAGGVQRVAAACEVSLVAVYKWLKKGRLPRTDYSGETRYAAIIAEACRARDPATRVTREGLLGGAATVAASA